MARSDETWSRKLNEVLSYVVMLTTTCLDMIGLTIVKAAMNDGLTSIVYIVYSNALGILILLPIFILHTHRNIGRPRLTMHILVRFFVLGLFGICLCQVLMYVGVYYSSPTLSSAIWNLSPAMTFMLAFIFRMEKLGMMTSPTTIARLMGTVIAISGAMVFTFYQGPLIFANPDSSNHLLLLSSPSSDWVFGGLVIFLSNIFGCIWNVLQSATTKEFPDQFTIVFFYCLFGTIQCVALAPFLEPNPSAWMVQPGIRMIAVVAGAVYVILIRTTAITWCLEKKGPVFVAMFSPLSIVIGIILGVTFLGDALHFGSAIGAVIIALGFYAVMWGQAKEKNKTEDEMDKSLNSVNESGSSDQNVPLL